MNDQDPLRVLVVCTANQCRSPMAAALLRHRLEARGIPALVASSGLLAGGVPASPGAVRALAGRGLDLADHRSTQTTPDLVDGTDLVLCMARRHVREVAVLRPDALDRTFTLKELVRRAARAGGRPADATFGEWLAKLAEGRRRRDLVGDDPRDDVFDPIGLPDARYLATAAELDDLVERFVRLAFPIHGEQEPGPSPQSVRA